MLLKIERKRIPKESPKLKMLQARFDGNHKNQNYETRMFPLDIFLRILCVSKAYMSKKHVAVKSIFKNSIIINKKVKKRQN
jgi:hypothetical protein